MSAFDAKRTSSNRAQARFLCETVVHMLNHQGGQCNGTHSPHSEQAACCIGPSAIQDRLDRSWLLHAKEDRGQRTDPIRRGRPVAEEVNSLQEELMRVAWSADGT